MTDARAATHSSPVWRERAEFIIAVEIEPGDTAIAVEQLWAKKVDGNLYEICCIPFFAYNLALGDVVRAEPRGDREFVVAEVTEPSGRFVFRVWFGGTNEPREVIVGAINTLGGLMEWSSENLLAVDARDAAHAQAVANFLHEQEGLGRLVYETGKSA